MVFLQKQPAELFLEIYQNSQKNSCARVSFLMKLQAWGLQLYLKKALTKVFSFEFCEISKNTFFTHHLWATIAVFIFSKIWRISLKSLKKEFKKLATKH